MVVLLVKLGKMVMDALQALVVAIVVVLVMVEQEVKVVLLVDPEKSTQKIFIFLL